MFILTCTDETFSQTGSAKTANDTTTKSTGGGAVLKSATGKDAATRPSIILLE